MQLNNKLLLVVIAGLWVIWLSSCSEIPVEYTTDGLVPARFSPRISTAVGGNVATRVMNQTWTGNETVGIRMIAANSSNLPADAVFSTYQPSDDTGGESATLIPTATDQTIYYPVDGSNVHFYAFSPYQAPVNNTVTFGTTDQSDQPKLEAVDFIWTKTTTGTYNKNNPTVNLSFAHKQSKIVVTTTKGAGVSATDFGSPTLTMTDMPYSGTYGLGNGSLDNSTIQSGTITPYISTPAADKVVWQAIVPEHNGTDYTDRQFNFSFNNKNYSYPVPNTQEYLAGKVYNYEFTLSTSGLSLTGSEVIDWDAENVVWSDDFYLTLSKASINLYKEASTDHELTIKTNHSGTISRHRSNNASTIDDSDVNWLTLSTLSGSGTSYSLTYSVSANASDSPRTGYIHIKVGSVLTAIVKVIQSADWKPDEAYTYENLKDLAMEDANCFMVNPGEKIVIPTTRAFTEEHASFPNSETFYPDVLWADARVIKSVQGYKSKENEKLGVLLIDTYPEAGNAVIALRATNGTGQIYWSWHIWVTDPNSIATYTNTSGSTSFTFMDRNLGATKAGTGSGLGTGLFYQWGRKDPFPATEGPNDIQNGGGSFTVQASNTTTGTIEYTIQYPHVFLTASNSPNDWLNAARNNTLWGDESTDKSLYDPCPSGWRVPLYAGSNNEDSPWNGFTATGKTFDNGYNFGMNAIYPASGYRFRDTGNLTAGGQGWYLSGTPLVDDIQGLLLRDGKVDLNITISSRSEGMSVRCVKQVPLQ